MRLLLLCLLVGSFSTTQAQPNILLLIADDLGYSDVGCYGGEISTPNIDALAAKGVQFSRFHTSPSCAPTRAMLLSGSDNHTAGMGRQGISSNNYGYEGYLTDRIVTIPQVLKKAGYHTYIAGKWHVGYEKENWPRRKGFERSFVMLTGAGNHYDDQGLFKSYPTTPYVQDGRPARWPKGAYSTTFYTDKLIEFIHMAKDDGKPFFGMLSYTSPHWPLQVDEKYWRKYEGRYAAGYEQLRQARFDSLKSRGLIPSDMEMPEPHPDMRPWDALTEEEQLAEARKMELYAGMVDNLDSNIGRLLQYLRENGLYDNTLIIFMSDNGAAANDYYTHKNLGPFLQAHFSDKYEDMGEPHSFISYGLPWAEASSVPFKNFKTRATEGGLVAPLIISGPGVDSVGYISDAFVTVTDLAPTFYEVAGATYPTEWNGHEPTELIGESMEDLLAGIETDVHDEDYTWGMEHNQRSFIIKGEWKLVNDAWPHDPTAFELYNIIKDPAEQNDMSQKKARIFREMKESWDAYIASQKVIFGPLPGDDE